jgi:hypothetical protein
VPRKVNSEREVAFAAWRDMVDEPEKYGSDLENEWLALDAELRAGSGHWRLEAHWLSKEAELEEALANAQLTWRDIFTRVARLAAQKGEREWFRRDVHRILKANRKAARKQVKVANKAATKIQAAIRGHLARSNANFRDCCMCLAHRVCPLQTDVGMMCRDCAEQGPHEDTTGPVADPWNWFRADYTDTRKRPCLACNVCDAAPATEKISGVLYCDTCLDDQESCRECGSLFLKGTGPGLGFCSRECQRY